ncbi:MAG: EF-hand domain-containing protein [Phycisphaerales bacterium]
MSTKLQRLALVAAAGLCAPAFAQDSVSNTGAGLPGDALSPYDAATQCADYVADLVPFETSKGNTFGIVPILKAPRVDAAFFNNLLSAQSISPDVLLGVPSASPDYSVWSMPGQGINPQNNSGAGSVAGPANTNQFALGFTDFGGNYNGVVGAVVNVDPNNPGRLYVARVQSAVNGNSSADNVAQIGYGSIDADGNQYFRADDFGVGGGAGLINVSDDNLFRTRLLDRDCGTLNVISGNPATFDGTDAFDVGFAGGALVAPNMGPASVFGGNGIVATGVAFAGGEYAYGAGGPTTKTAAALSGSTTRGTLGYSKHNLLGGNGVSSFGQLNQDAGGSTRIINIWEVNAAGAPVGNLGFTPPAAITDNATGVVVNAPQWEFARYRSQAAFRGGAGTVALTRDPATGATLATAPRDFVGGQPNLPLNDIPVLRYNPSTGAQQWTLAAYIDPTNTTNGKPICDSNGMAIGRLEELFDVTGGAPVGPSLSPAAFDAAGNVWFIASVGFFDTPVPVSQSASGNVVDFDSALIRAIYDPATFSYTLEKVIELGDVFRGANSDRDYQITFMGVADGDSVSSGTFFSGNVSEEAFGGLNPASLDTADPRTTAGVVVNAQITYDVDGDGDFEDSSAGNPGIDEEYQVLLYIGFPGDTGVFCDCDGNGTINIDDIDCFVAGFLGGDLSTADCDGNGTINIDDIDCFVACFLANVG